MKTKTETEIERLTAENQRKDDTIRCNAGLAGFCGIGPVDMTCQV